MSRHRKFIEDNVVVGFRVPKSKVAEIKSVVEKLLKKYKRQKV
jgi:hypothetical protein